jgi:hypothetical protein
MEQMASPLVAEMEGGDRNAITKIRGAHGEVSTLRIPLSKRTQIQKERRNENVDR